MTYEDYCKIEGIEENPTEKKMYEAGQHDVANDIASCFGITTGTLDEDRFLKRLAKLGLVSNEFDFCISSEEIQLYKKAILTVAKKLKVEDKKCKEIIKRTVVENFCCNDCKELGLFAECLKKEKSCETIVSEWFDEVMEQ